MNWTGNYAEANIAGTATSGTTTSLTFSAASWTTNAFANFTLAITSGTGSGQEAVITSNTATVLTFPTLSTAPDATSVFEIIMAINDGDHFTGNTTITNQIWRMEPSSIAYVDGNYTITPNGTTAIRFLNTESTVSGIETNSYLTSSKAAWGYVHIAVNDSAPAIEWGFMEIKGANYVMYIDPSNAVGDGSGMVNFYAENGNNSFLLGSSWKGDTVFSNILLKDCGGNVTLSFPSSEASTSSVTFKNCWVENVSGVHLFAANGSTTQVLDSCVHIDYNNNQFIYAVSGKTQEIRDSYFTSAPGASGIIIGQASASNAGIQKLTRNYIKGCNRPGLFASDSTGTFTSSFNSYIASISGTYQVWNIGGAGYEDVMTSDYDYIVGFAGAVIGNVDTSNATTSTETPAQYSELTSARTNAQSSQVKPLTTDNIVEGTPTSSQITITFDSTNAGIYSTTVDADSASGGTTLNVTATTGFEVGETIEIGYGTAREETGVIASISAGVSLTLTANLTYTHTSAQGDAVAKCLRNKIIPFIAYGVTTGVYDMQSTVPPREQFGKIWTSQITEYNGNAVSFDVTGHSVTLDNLEGGTTYYYKCCGYLPDGTLIEGTEGDFTTSAVSGGGGANAFVY